MEAIVSSVKEQFESLGYEQVVFVHRNNEAIYYKAYDPDSKAVDLKVVIDDESFFDDWELWCSYNGYIWIAL
ncbi:hypothetical protein [Paenibacillus chitinolyticus]|uniref:hypothetical protein n=1 Tax=Paenibacillus chitinolyticus TaxID=79263 RepID=UPI003CFBC9BF